MLSFPNCKINLGLYITRKRDDGYHDLETVFYPLPLRDALEVVPPSPEWAAGLHLSGREVKGRTEDNLVWKAWQLLKKEFPGRVEDSAVFLHKKIPSGAGLGGASADGAFMLMLLNEYADLGLTTERLAELALQLGSDCPFFIYNTPQYAAGRGERMMPVCPDLSAYSIQLICPGVHISTAEAFRMIRPAKADTDLKQLASIPVGGWKERLRNDFERPVFEAYPDLKEIKDQLYRAGAVYASMSGSGSAIYGIFPKGVRAVMETGLPFEEHYMADL